MFKTLPFAWPSRPQLILWGLWVGFSTAAAVLAVIATQAVLLLNLPGDMYGFLLFLMCVIFLGLGQGLVLRRRSISIVRWTLLNFIAWMIAYLAAFFEPALASGGSVVVFGLASGLGQWLLSLRPVFERSWIWLPAAALGWGWLGLLMGLGFSSEWQFILVGLIPALFSGAALAWLWTHGTGADN